MRRLHRACARSLGACVALSLVAGRALAEPTTEEQALATALFKDAKSLLESGRVPAACRKLEESQRLDPKGGTLLNLAVCHEREGKTATAWVEFRDARVIAERAQRPERVALADERLAVLDAKLSKLVVRVPPAADVGDVTVTADGHAVSRAAWGSAMPVDPGEHVVTAEAPGKKPFRTSVTVGPEGDVKTLEIPAWEDAAPSEPLASVPADVASVRVDPPPASPRPNRVPALVAGSLGVVAIGVGSVFGVRAITKHNESNDACTTNPCGSASVTANDAAKKAADASTAAFTVGLVGLGVGAILWLTGTPASRASTQAVRVVPSWGPGQGSLELRGVF